MLIFYLERCSPTFLKPGGITNIVLVNDIPESSRKELAYQIVENPTWRNIGLYFESEYGFKISEAQLRAKYPPGTPDQQLCEYLIEELAQRKVSIRSFKNALNNPNIGMNAIADEVEFIARALMRYQNNDNFCSDRTTLNC